MIQANITVEFSLKEVCERAELPSEVLIEIVEEGVLSPQGKSPAEWSFDATMLGIAKRAARLHRDFDIEWPSIPLYLDLIEELEKVREENKRLQQRLSRFLLDE